MMHAHLSALREANDRLDALLSRIGNCADAFNGSQPTEAGRPDKAPAGHSLNSQFQEQINGLHQRIGAILSQVSRIEDEVLDGPKTQVGSDLGGLARREY